MRGGEQRRDDIRYRRCRILRGADGFAVHPHHVGVSRDVVTSDCFRAGTASCFRKFRVNVHVLSIRYQDPENLLVK